MASSILNCAEENDKRLNEPGLNQAQPQAEGSSVTARQPRVEIYDTSGKKNNKKNAAGRVGRGIKPHRGLFGTG